MSPITKAEASTALAFASGIPALSGRDFVKDAAGAMHITCAQSIAHIHKS